MSTEFLLPCSPYRQIQFRPDDNIPAYISTLLINELPVLLARATVEGTIPQDGPFLLAANHSKWKDLMIAHWASAIKGRPVRFLSRRTLLDPDAQESGKAQERRTQKDFTNSAASGGLLKEIRHLCASYLKLFNPIPVDIGNPRRDLLPQIKAAFADSLAVGTFPQGTRKPRLDLLDILNGTSLVASKNPDVPIVPMGISGADGGIFQKVTVKIGQPFTYREVFGGLGKRDRSAFNTYLADRLAELIIDPKLYPAWELNRHHGMSVDELRTLSDEGYDMNDLLRSRLALLHGQRPPLLLPRYTPRKAEMPRVAS